MPDNFVSNNINNYRIRNTVKLLLTTTSKQRPPATGTNLDPKKLVQN
jgi:hypothetical protein